MGPEHISNRERVQAAAGSGSLGPHGVSVHAQDIAVSQSLSLATSIFLPETAASVPAVLIRTPYGKEFWRNDGIFWASHGFGLVLQDCRGAVSFFDEADDGEATVRWIQNQDWFDGALGLQGMSYMGFTAWATASRCRAEVNAISVSYYSSDRISSWYPGGSFSLDMALAWSAMQDSDNAASDPDRDAALGAPLVSFNAYMHLPLIDADEAHTGKQIPFFRERLTHWRDDPHWKPLDYSQVLSDGCPPTLLFGGWYDYQRRYLWEDFGRLRQAGVPHRLIFGPWMHGGGWAEGNLEALRWFNTHLRQQGDTHYFPISLCVTGGEGWKEMGDLPELDAQSQRWYLAENGHLASAPNDRSIPTTYTYDPADPTPSVGLASFDPERAMPCDNRSLEERPDVITFTADALEEPIILIGPVSATLWVKSSAPSADFFVRLTDVHPDGSSFNVIDALRRVEPEDQFYAGDEPMKLEVQLGPCAHRFDTGHRMRIQISSGAFPFYIRNLGTGEDVATGTRLRVAEQTLLHERRFPSHVTVVRSRRPS
jgi:putative CocE/NonD family hydrolase